MHVIFAQMRHHWPVASDTFFSAFRKPCAAPGDAVDVIGIDQQGAPQLARRARKPRQDQHPRVLLVLRGDIFLGDEIHPVPQRRDHSKLSHPIESREGRARNRTIDVADRRPVQIAELAIDPAGGLGDFPVDLDIFRYFFASSGRSGER